VEYKLCNPQNTSASHLGKKGNILAIPVSAEHIKEQRTDIPFFFHWTWPQHTKKQTAKEIPLGRLTNKHTLHFAGQNAYTKTPTGNGTQQWHIWSGLHYKMIV